MNSDCHVCAPYIVNAVELQKVFPLLFQCKTTKSLQHMNPEKGTLEHQFFSVGPMQPFEVCSSYYGGWIQLFAKTIRK